MFDIKPTLLLSGPYAIVSIVVIAVTAIVLAIAIKKALQSGKIKLRLFGGELDVNNGAEQSDPSPDLIHTPKMSRIVAKVTEVVAKITEIKSRTTLCDQMIYAEQKLTILHDMLSRQYAHALSEKIKKDNDATGHDDYLFFNNMLTLTISNLKRTLREILQHNHLESYSEQEFQKYTKEKSDLIIAKAIQFMWAMYPASRMIVTFVEFDTIMSEKQAYLRDIFIDIFNESLKISKEKRIEIDALKSELDNFNPDI